MPMTIHRRRSSHVGAEDARDQRSVEASGVAKVIDVTVTEWTVDLGAGSDGSQALTTTYLAAAGFVDFDAVETLHTTRREAGPRR
jgi:hypothetical protein